MDSALHADRARPRGPRCASVAVLVPRLLVERALLEARTATGGLTLGLAQLDQLAGDPGALEGVPRARGQVHGQRSEEHTSELQSLMRISYAVFCLKKKKKSKY